MQSVSFPTGRIYIYIYIAGKKSDSLFFMNALYTCTNNNNLDANTYDNKKVRKIFFCCECEFCDWEQNVFSYFFFK